MAALVEVEPMMNDDEKVESPAGCACCGGSMKRRQVLAGMATVGGMLAVSPAFAQSAEMLPPQVGDFLTIKDDGTPLTADDLREGTSPKTAYAVSPDGVIRNGDFNNSLLVIRFKDEDLSEEAKTTAIEGVLAYSAICTHAGCEVTNWLREEKNLECPCHGSHFDPKNNGAVIFGPASRKLPQIGLAVSDDGKLTVASGFDSRIGGDETM